MTPADEMQAAAKTLHDQGTRGLQEDYDPQIPAEAVIAFAKWLDAYATHLAASTHPGWQEAVSGAPLTVARAILGQP